MLQRKILISPLKNLLFACLFVCSNQSSVWAIIGDMETARQKSTAGAGVGSVLLDEATMLNPAPMAFFNVSSVYYTKQSAKVSYDDAPDYRPRPRQENSAFIVSDTTGNLKGSISYQNQMHDFDKRIRYGVSLATTASEKSSIGITYWYDEEEVSEDGLLYLKRKKDQFHLGIFHALTPELTVGTVFFDPLKKASSAPQSLIGIQYQYLGFINLMFDAGANIYDDLANTFLWKTAVQMKIFSDAYLRFGVAQDKLLHKKTNGVGFGWVQPRLVLDFAYSRTTLAESTLPKQKGQNYKESSFSISYRF